MKKQTNKINYVAVFGVVVISLFAYSLKADVCPTCYSGSKPAYGQFCIDTVTKQECGVVMIIDGSIVASGFTASGCTTLMGNPNSSISICSGQQVGPCP